MSAELGAFAGRLRELRTLVAETAKEAAPLVEAAVRETAAVGTDPDGKAWPTKRDGGRALPNVAGEIRAMARGAVVIVTLTGAYVFHHYSKGRDQRRVLPDGGAGIPPRIADAVREAQRRVFERIIRR